MLRGGATPRGRSTLLVDAVVTIKNAPGIARTSRGRCRRIGRDARRRSICMRKEDGTRAGLTVRGVEPHGCVVRPEIRDRRRPHVSARPARDDRRDEARRRSSRGSTSATASRCETANGPSSASSRAAATRTSRAVIVDADDIACPRTGAPRSNSMTVLLNVGGCLRRFQDGAHDQPHAVGHRGARVRLLRAAIGKLRPSSSAS